MKTAQQIVDWMRVTGIARITIDYSGSGDEGWVNGVEVDGVTIPNTTRAAIERWAYAFLQMRAPGWEIDDGSRGTIIIEDGEIEHEHTNYYTESTTELETLSPASLDHVVARDEN